MTGTADAAGGDLLGVVLAGGGSRRFGSHKALAEYRGEPLWKRGVRVLEDVGLPVVVVANAPEVQAAVTSPVRPDVRPGRGPLAGIETGLLEAEGRGLRGIVALACDLVRVESAVVAQLVSAWDGTGVIAFDAPGPWGAEPLCAAWAVDVLPTVSHALNSGLASPGALLSTLSTRILAPSGLREGSDRERIFRSANRPADLEPDGSTP